MKIKKHIPNIITCGNLFCGCLAIIFAFNDNLCGSAYLVCIAGVLDFLDGFVARILKVGGELGKQLDSLADMVTFGVVPGIVMYQLILKIVDINSELQLFFPYIAFSITIFSCIRLAKFNIDTRQTLSFIGVPTPANTILICSIPLINQNQPSIGSFNVLAVTTNIYFLLGITFLMSYLMIAELPLFALKFKNFSWAGNKIRFVFLITAIILLMVLQFIAIPFIIFLYIVLSIINNTLNRNEIQSRN